MNAVTTKPNLASESPSSSASLGPDRRDDVAIEVVDEVEPREHRQDRVGVSDAHGCEGLRLPIPPTPLTFVRGEPVGGGELRAKRNRQRGGSVQQPGHKMRTGGRSRDQPPARLYLLRTKRALFLFSLVVEPNSRRCYAAQHRGDVLRRLGFGSTGSAGAASPRAAGLRAAFRAPRVRVSFYPSLSQVLSWHSFWRAWRSFASESSSPPCPQPFSPASSQSFVS